jgi:hypothetical protein
MAQFAKVATDIGLSLDDFCSPSNSHCATDPFNPLIPPPLLLELGQNVTGEMRLPSAYCGSTNRLVVLDKG